MEEHRELVEDERGACAEHDCQERDPELAWLEADGEAAGDEAHHDAWHEVVHVHVADVRAPPAAGPRHPGVEPRPCQREDERDQQEEGRLPSRVVDVYLVPREEAKEVHAVSTTIVRVYGPGPASGTGALVWASVPE